MKYLGILILILTCLTTEAESYYLYMNDEDYNSGTKNKLIYWESGILDAKNNFHSLKIVSDAINKGKNLACEGITRDLAGITRLQLAFDIGAF